MAKEKTEIELSTVLRRKATFTNVHTSQPVQVFVDAVAAYGADSSDAGTILNVSGQTLHVVESVADVEKAIA